MSEIRNLNIVIVGVGGQGTLLASRILSTLALKLGLDVKASEIHGMAQRGGSVVTFVRMGERVYAPMAARILCWPLNSWKRCARWDI